MFPKHKPIRSEAIRRAAEGQPCTIRIPGCPEDRETTVFCHFSYASGGMGTKAPDISGAFGCAYCHRIVDGQAKRPHGVLREDVEWCKARGMAETLGILVQMGIVSIQGAA